MGGGDSKAIVGTEDDQTPRSRLYVKMLWGLLLIDWLHIWEIQSNTWRKLCPAAGVSLRPSCLTVAYS